MDNRRITLNLIAVILLSSLIVAGLTWANYRFVTQDSGMNAFLPGWAGTRWFMTKGWSPYSEQTTQEVQKLAYGRLAQSGEDQGFFLHPFYSILIFAPFALLADLAIARAAWMLLLELAVVGIAVCGVSLSRWRISRWMLGGVLLFALIWYPSVRVILSGDIVVFCSLFIFLACVAIRSEHDVLAGFALALASIRPQMMILVTAFIVIWGISHNRWVLLWSLLVSVVLLSLTISLFIPDWVVQNVRQVVAYWKITFIVTPGSVVTYWLPGIGKQVGWGFVIFIAILLVWEWVQALRQDFRWFLWTAYLTLTATHLVGIPTSLDAFIAILPVWILVLATLDERWGKLGRGLMVVGVFILSAGVWVLSIADARRGIPPDLDAAIILFVPLFIIVGLYWVRLWAIRPQRLFEELAGHI